MTECGTAAVIVVQVPGLRLSLKTNWNAGPERGDTVGVSAPAFPRGSFSGCQTGHFCTHNASRSIPWKRDS